MAAGKKTGSQIVSLKEKSWQLETGTVSQPVTSDPKT